MQFIMLNAEALGRADDCGRAQDVVCVFDLCVIGRLWEVCGSVSIGWNKGNRSVVVGKGVCQECI